MIPLARTLKDAERIYSRSPKAAVCCVDSELGTRELITNSLAEARAFFNGCGAVAAY